MNTPNNQNLNLDKFNAEKLGEHLKNAAGVVVGVGILAAIFGLGIGIGSSWFGD
ncbi:MAG: hypothetical protein ACKOPK_00985 [Dolichospermum sp.]